MLATPVQFVVGWPFLAEAVRRARRFSANMDTLVAIGTGAAYTFSLVELLRGGHDMYFETIIRVAPQGVDRRRGAGLSPA